MRAASCAALAAALAGPVLGLTVRAGALDVLTAFVDRDLGPRDLVAVLKPLDSLLTIRMTRDPAVVRHAIDNFDGRKGDYEPRNAFEREFIAGAPARIDQIRAQVATS